MIDIRRFVVGRCMIELRVVLCCVVAWRGVVCLVAGRLSRLALRSVHISDGRTRLVCEVEGALALPSDQ